MMFVGFPWLRKLVAKLALKNEVKKKERGNLVAMWQRETIFGIGLKLRLERKDSLGKREKREREGRKKIRP
ncbi:hypothetical protein TSUD_354920 [Trifolium subterraneum]|uniref:Uncharacterized protein n=1 Tax=Trifolium subterraneum TaxID=3900 RepID=A0A2Z6MDC8_TRISU|nr:hypothetical protein TSUD_354920 [Trifolium subterraneum]